MRNHNEEPYTAEYKMDYLRKVHGTHYFVLPKRKWAAKQATYLFHKILAILETSGSPSFLGCDPLSKTVIFRDPPACNAYFKMQEGQKCVNVLRSKLTLNEKSTDKLINSPSAFVDMPVRTTTACCLKPDRNSDSRSSVTES
ncbi:conserved hypothetical protein [Trichinella spiralis]|uniref:hypothetical protein n=1 Tax=Trichinella spiralis TaxID=6334 RepID=UPI0001EFC086|nr:conserved hypothetical protein [Trichinella spiralis]